MLLLADGRRKWGSVEIALYALHSTFRLYQLSHLSSLYFSDWVCISPLHDWDLSSIRVRRTCMLKRLTDANHVWVFVSDKVRGRGLTWLVREEVGLRDFLNIIFYNIAVDIFLFDTDWIHNIDLEPGSQMTRCGFELVINSNWTLSQLELVVLKSHRTWGTITILRCL